MKCFLTLAVFITAALAAPKSINKRGAILWDGRIPEGTPLTDFDEYSTARIFDAKYVLGQGQSWSTVLNYPNITPSYFDSQVGAVPIELTINDKSIFNPGSAQPGFRRSELLPSGNNGQDATVQGITTIHFSIQENPARPLNYSHEYQLVFQETNDYSSHVWTLRAGTAFNTRPVPGSNARTLRLTSSTANGRAAQTLYSVPFGNGQKIWHNWAITNNWNAGSITVYYSTDNNPLRQVVSNRSNPNTGKGQAHIGILKMPLAPAANPVTDGYQPRNINEGVFYGGLFIEDSTGNSVTLS